ncbi:hypothetical protein POTOM_040381 [Populus tomentosa]|uniref:TF-B3 domain-containing protein n=1 Tax=Populus tomentosa TaxID=118781 RepID=A0A8X7YNZ4_POPTO|nr:hypothetical protein POTOM_040381 [Populus tomentosa]
MEVMNKILSESDAKNKRLEFPARNLSAFPMPDGQNSVEFVAFDLQEHQWRLKVSIRNEGRYAKPWLKGEWDDYVHQKGLKKGDKVILTVQEEENGERIYLIALHKSKHEAGLMLSVTGKEKLSFGGVRSSLWLCNELSQNTICVCLEEGKS